jgi:transposase-like protein
MKMKSAPKKISAAPAPIQLPIRERRHFDEVFRQHAVALINGGRPLAEVARELGVSIYSLYEWRRKSRRKIDLQAPIPTSVEALEGGRRGQALILDRILSPRGRLGVGRPFFTTSLGIGGNDTFCRPTLLGA